MLLMSSCNLIKLECFHGFQLPEIYARVHWKIFQLRVIGNVDFKLGFAQGLFLHMG